MGKLFRGWPLVTALVLLFMVAVVGLLVPYVSGFALTLMAVLTVGAVVRWIVR